MTTITNAIAFGSVAVPLYHFAMVFAADYRSPKRPARFRVQAFVAIAGLTFGFATAPADTFFWMYMGVATFPSLFVTGLLLALMASPFIAIYEARAQARCLPAKR